MRGRGLRCCAEFGCVEGVGGINEQSRLVLVVFEHLSHRMNGGFASAFNSGTHLKVAARLLYFRLQDPRDGLAHNPSKRFADADGPDVIASFLERHQTTREKGRKRGWVHKLRAQSARQVSNGFAQVAARPRRFEHKRVRMSLASIPYGPAAPLEFIAIFCITSPFSASKREEGTGRKCPGRRVSGSASRALGCFSISFCSTSGEECATPPAPPSESIRKAARTLPCRMRRAKILALCCGVSCGLFLDNLS